MILSLFPTCNTPARGLLNPQSYSEYTLYEEGCFNDTCQETSWQNTCALMIQEMLILVKPYNKLKSNNIYLRSYVPVKP